jgi:WD40 repeat protein
VELSRLSLSATGEALLLESQEARHTILLIGQRSIYLPGLPVAFASSVDALRLVLQSHDGRVLMWGPDRRELVNYEIDPSIQLTDLVVSPDGYLLVGSARRTGLHFWEAQTGKPLLTLDGLYMGEVVFSPDAASFAVAQQSTCSKGWLYNRDEPLVRGPIGGTSDLFDLTFSPDGTWLVTCDSDGVRIWEAQTALERRSLALGGGLEVRSLRVTPDGQFALVRLNTGEMRLWPAEMLWPD